MYSVGAKVARLFAEQVALAVGGEEFMREIRDSLGAKAVGRSISGYAEQQQLRDVRIPYNTHLTLKKGF